MFFCIARLAAPGPCADNRRAPERTICSPCRRGAAGAGEHPPPKAGAGGRVGWGASGRKKGSARVIDPNIPSHKTLGPASPWCVAHPDPTLFSLRTAPNTHKGQHTSACGGLGSVRLCVCQRSGESGVSPRKKKTPGIGRRCTGVRARGLAIAGDPHARSLRPPPGLLLPP